MKAFLKLHSLCYQEEIHVFIVSKFKEYLNFVLFYSIYLKKLINVYTFLTNRHKFCGDMDTSLHKYLSFNDINEFYYDRPQMISMLKRELGILFLVSCLILASVPTALCLSPAPTVYVAGDGSGDFNCDGKDDHVQINQALKFVADSSEYTTVHLKGPFTYVY